jgi:hypothetical protein
VGASQQAREVYFVIRNRMNKFFFGASLAGSLMRLETRLVVNLGTHMKATYLLHSETEFTDFFIFEFHPMYYAQDILAAVQNVLP